MPQKDRFVVAFRPVMAGSMIACRVYFGDWHRGDLTFRRGSEFKQFIDVFVGATFMSEGAMSVEEACKEIE